MVTDEQIPQCCPSCRMKVFVGRKSAPASIDDDSDTADIDQGCFVWTEAECENCGKKVVTDGSLVVDDRRITTERDTSESSLHDFTAEKKKK